jgi:hypothetical protein
LQFGIFLLFLAIFKKNIIPSQARTKQMLAIWYCEDSVHDIRNAGLFIFGVIILAFAI